MVGNRQNYRKTNYQQCGVNSVYLIFSGHSDNESFQRQRIGQEACLDYSWNAWPSRLIGFIYRT